MRPQTLVETNHFSDSTEINHFSDSLETSSSEQPRKSPHHPTPGIGRFHAIGSLETPVTSAAIP